MVIVNEQFGLSLPISLDGRMTAATMTELMQKTPVFVGLQIYCEEDDKYYKVISTKTLTSSNGVPLGICPKEVAAVSASGLNFRGEYVLNNVPSQPWNDGDWYRNTTYGTCYVYQNGSWNVMVKDGTNGADGAVGEKGEKGDKGDTGATGPMGTSIKVKGTLGSINELPSTAETGDCYIIDGDLWVYTEENGWQNVGRFQGYNSYLDIRYSNDIASKTFTANNGLTSGIYIGIRVTTEAVTAEPADFDEYIWSELRGTITEQIFISVTVGVTPGKPSGSTVAAACKDGWVDYVDEATKEGYITWMSVAESLDGTVITDWSAPIRITGEQGVNGEDGDSIQFVFKLSDSNSVVPSWNSTAVQDDSYRMVDYGWEDSALGVTQETPYEWMSMRTGSNLNGTKVWTAYSEPVVWASYGTDGMDGGGAEYIFFRTSTYDYSEVEAYYKPDEWKTQSNYNTYDFVPRDDKWEDNPQGVDPYNICEWVSTRRYAPGDDGKIVFGDFSTPALWAKWAADGASTMVISLTNDNTFIPCNTERKPWNPGNPPTTRISAYIGAQNVTGNTEFTVTCDNENITDAKIVSIDSTQSELTYTLPTDIVLEDKTIFTITSTYAVEGSDVSYQGYKRFVLTTITDPNYVYYELKPSTQIVKRDNEGTEYPQQVECKVIKFTPDGTTNVTDTLSSEGLSLIYLIDNKTTENVYTRPVDFDGVENIVYFRLVDATNTSDIIDEESVEVIKDGTNGTNIDLAGSVETKADLANIVSPNVGDTYYVEDEGCLYVWDGTEWKNVGEIKGEPGQSVYIHQKYAIGSATDSLSWTDDYGETLPTGTTNSVRGWTAIWTDNSLDAWWPTVDGVKVDEDTFKPGDYPDDPTIGRWIPMTGLNGGRTVAIYTLNAEEPDVPSTTDITRFAAGVDGWHLVMPTGEKGKYIWQCTGTLLDGPNDTVINGTWQGPSRISGLDGNPGVDAEYDEFVYYVTDFYPTINASTGKYTNSPSVQYDTTDAEYQNPDYFPWTDNDTDKRWTDNPQGVTYDNPCEWVSSRHKSSDGTWGTFTDPVPWAVYGEKGQDGDGYEYIYKRTTDSTAPAVPTATSTDDDFVPSGWTDDPTGIDENNKYEWVCTRRKKDGVWGSFTGSYSNPGYAALWAAYVEGPTGKNGTLCIYAFVQARTQPATPEAETSNLPTEPRVPQYTSDNAAWQLTPPNQSNDDSMLTWMTYAVLTPSDTVLTWSEPIRITGAQGIDGNDGTEIEFVYFGSADKFNGSNAPEFDSGTNDPTQSSFQVDDYKPTTNGVQWEDNAIAVDGTTYKTVYAAMRMKVNSSWQAFSTPYPWSVWGENGIDGDGVQYIFCRAKSQEAFWKVWNTMTSEYDGGVLGIDSSADYKNVEYIPEQAARFELDYIAGNFGDEDDLVDEGFTDDPSEVTADWKCIFVSVRKMKNGSWDQTNGTPIPFSTPTLWAHYGTDAPVTSTVFCRTEEYGDVTGPSGGSYEKPIPDGDVWTDGIPATGGEYIWASTCTFYSNGTNSGWTAPALMRDRQGYDVEFSDYDGANPGTPDDTTATWYDPTNDTSIDWSTMIWRAERRYVNHTWTEWVVTKIKGEDGKPGDPGAPGEQGISALTIDLAEDNATVPCKPLGALFDGDHFGAGTSSTFSSFINLVPSSYSATVPNRNNIGVYYGVTDISSECTITYTATNLSIHQPTTNICVVQGFTSEDVRSGTVVITAEHSTYGTVTTTYRLTKAYSGSAAEFVYHQIHPDVNQVICEYDVSAGTFSINPTTLSFKLDKYTQDGKSVVEMIEPYRVYLTSHDISGNVLKTFATSNFVTSYDITSITKGTAYITMYLYDGTESTGISNPFDEERIPVLWNYDGATAELPDWLDEWGGDNVATLGEKNLAAALIYVGDSPTVESATAWCGLLLGSKLTTVYNMPEWNSSTKELEYNDVTDFSGILGLKGSTIGSDGGAYGDSEVTFALNADTGKAYFNGTVIAENGVFEYGAFKTCTAEGLTVTKSTITNCNVSNLTVTNSGYDYNVIIGGTGESGAQAVTITTPDAYNEEADLTIVSINCDSAGKTGTMLIVDLTTTKDGYYSRTTITGGSVKVEYASDAAFANVASTTEIMSNGLKITAIPTVSSGATHSYAKGLLYVDSEGVVRVSAGNGSYITG